MSKLVLGVLAGGALGAVDGLSAWLSADARPVMLAVVIGSTLKGIATGLLAGLIATRTLLGAFVGFVTQRYPNSAGGTSGVGTIVGIMLAVTLSSASLHAVWQSTAAPDPLSPVAPLVGRWAGTTEGQPGKGTVEREYERILGSRFVQVHNRSTYPPQERNRSGEVHEDIGLFSFDSGRRQIVFRQFHTEGFVNQYVMDPSSTHGRLVLTTEAIENIPTGWRARETYVITTPDQMEEIFELAEPGKEFEVYSRTRLSRVR